MPSHILLNNLSDEEKCIILLLQKKQMLSKEEILQHVGIKSTTFIRLLEHLKREELIIVCGEGDSTGGRKPLLYGINPDKKLYTVGISIALHHLDIAAFSISGTPVFSQIIPSNYNVSPWEAVRVLGENLHEQLKLHSIETEQVLGCGLSASPAMDREQGLLLKSLSFSFSDPLWISFPLRQALEKETGIRIVSMDTTANAGCIGEYLYGHGRSHARVLNIICGNAIRVGCITNGKLVRPTNDLDDAFGHMVIVANGEPCACGNYGCIDCYATGRAIQRYYMDEVKKGRGDFLVSDSQESSAIIAILKRAEQNDTIAVETVSKAAAMLGIGLANYINLFKPDIVTCSGYLIEESELYYNTLVEVVKKKRSCLGFSQDTIFTKRSDIGKAVIGASIMAMEACFDTFY